MASWLLALILILLIGGVVALVIIIMRAYNSEPRCKYCNQPLRLGRNAYICDSCEVAWSYYDEDDDLN